MLPVRASRLVDLRVTDPRLDVGVVVLAKYVDRAFPHRLAAFPAAPEKLVGHHGLEDVIDCRLGKRIFTTLPCDDDGMIGVPFLRRLENLVVRAQLVFSLGEANFGV